ncbi:MAG: prephenate dehydratase [Sutterellaceae bacterium]|nr:prephenate dehydratase [Burkholderiaceae bacterium]MDW8430806.1 prephenate dehydratase [Sutterellaceae bacterium]
MDEQLKPLREAIDTIDRRLVELLNERARLAQEIGRIKRDGNVPVYRPEREAEVLRKVAQINGGPLTEAALMGIYREVISACRALERPLRVAYLGPPGTFSELAMIKQFGAGVEGAPAHSIDEVFRAAETGAADFAVVPVENSTEGAVGRSLDLLLLTPLKILAEVSVPVRHHLLTQSGTLEGITRIVTHPQTLAQCAGWLNRHLPHVEKQSAASNAEAARIAAQDATAAAIAGENAASLYGLQVAAAHIQDDPQNRTRFVVLGNQEVAPSGRDKTSMILSVPNRAGAVYHMLAPLAQHGVSMTRFESRPARLGAWEYYFYVDIEGHEREPRVAAALQELRNVCAFYKSLGSYPMEP